MFSISDMESCIEEWFADADDVKEVAKTYAVIIINTEKQLNFMMDEMERGKAK